MPKHKQAGQTTVLTKRPRKSPENTCNAGATHRRHSTTSGYAAAQRVIADVDILSQVWRRCQNRQTSFEVGFLKVPEKAEGCQESQLVCRFCKSELQTGALKCTECGSYQGWRHLFSWYVPAVSATIALLLAFPTLYNVYDDLFGSPTSDARLVSATFQNGTLYTDLINLGETPALIISELICVERGVEENELTLNIRGGLAGDDTALSNIIIFNDPKQATRIAWNVWNARVGAIRIGELTSDQQGAIEDTALTIGLNQYQYYSEHGGTIEGLVSETIEASKQPSFLPMVSPFEYHLSLTVRLLQSEARQPQDEYEFECSINGEDQSRQFTILPFRMEFSAGSYGLNDANNLLQ